MMIRSLLPLPFVMLILVGCNSYKSKLPEPSSGESADTTAALDYNYVHSKVFQPYCLRCHSEAGGNDGDINLETYENVLANLEMVQEMALIERAMPPKKAGGPLPEFPSEVLRKWIEAGAPREAVTPEPTPEVKPEPTPAPTPEPTPEVKPEPTVVPQPSPSPTPEPPVIDPVVILPTWNDVFTKIIQAKCLECHAPGKKMEDVPLTDRAFVVDPANGLIVAGDPTSSEIYRFITREDRKRMPPARTGMTLSAQEIEAIRLWIANGAKD